MKKQTLDSRTIERMLRLAHTPPDDALLRRYFNACAGKDDGSALTDAERRWLTVNLDANPNWQQKWKELEKEIGHSVDWRRQARFPQAAVKSEPVVKPRFFEEWLPRVQPQWAFRLAFAAVVLAALYGTLWLVGRWGLPKTYELASVASHEEFLNVRVRGESVAAEAEFAAGAEALLSAPKDWLGLFPHYDRQKVDVAIVLLTRAFEATDDPFQRAEIAFFLAKAYLMKDEITGVKRWLNEALAQNVADYRREATELLKKLAEKN